MAKSEEFQGVSKCYVFKSRLQEYAQKMGIKIPVYETTKEGPSHEPSFRSTVVVNDVRYDSLVGFTHRKAAEQSAAEVALRELSKSGDAAKCISQPVQEIGLCKNLLQEYAQKMNFSVPVYQCKTDFSSRKTPVYSCTVEIGGIRYIGATATTKKEAEIKVARTALLAIWLSSNESSMGSFETSELTVLPSKKRRLESEEASNKPKRKKVPFSRKRMLKRKPNEENAVPGLESNEAMPQDSVSEDIPHANNVYAEHGPSTASDLTNGSNGNGFVGCGDLTTLAKEVNMVSAVKPMTAEAMPQDSVFEHIPHANNVNAEHGLSTTSDFNATNGSCAVGDSISPSSENTTTLAKEGNMVSAGPYLEASSVMPGPESLDQSQ
ncbi:PREDICTED: double-stranded RNA-binding protein 1 [Fragaria vesca subsp. vesca]|uniref:double-stranded RNA-binding protein 1 n=1 Tax=Fragaria vesca subsp. vesca TaxID=101020 RepID=UPI0002C2DE78|nr:PREDICTED: double-stranded RNA-binding protein 1 [Fragaria vesca subsp. vesca]XP_004299736.1 PREDICTED: double-stranded RNA-binding protein 1 [Fragaria vesca subsp. vesca]XP_011464670.1 PREDICTED: double-stranded RNA-binding protein 1 [Fragaria vesca subsp. vesca]